MARLFESLPDILKEELLLLLGIICATISAAILSGKLLLCMLLGLLTYLAWHLFHLVRLPSLIANRHSSDSYRPYGLWKGVFQDISTLHETSRQREHKLTHRQTQFQDVVSALPDAVVILGKSGRIDWMNPVAERLFGIIYSDTAGQVFLDCVRDPILSGYFDNKTFDQPLVFSPPANRSKIVSMFVTSITGQQQQLIVTSDITRQYHLDAAQRDFVANISHELRTPLTVISGLLEQIQMENSELPPDRRSIDLMQNQTIRMTHLITDLLTLSRLELNEQPPVEEEINVSELLTTIAEEARTISKSTSHIIQMNIESQVRLRGDRNELRTAISNLVTNAIRYTPNRTEVKISWNTDTEGAYLNVSDNGEGIAARHLPRLTERLYRVDASRSRDTGGTGLGLAIVQYVLERHNSELEISSTVGRGSTFTCHFPVDRLIAPIDAPSGS